MGDAGITEECDGQGGWQRLTEFLGNLVTVPFQKIHTFYITATIRSAFDQITYLPEPLGTISTMPSKKADFAHANMPL